MNLSPCHRDDPRESAPRPATRGSDHAPSDGPGVAADSAGWLPSLTPAELLDPAGRLRCDLPCVRCGYNLRTLPLDGCCPECNTHVRTACADDRLYLCDPALLRHVATGVRRFAFGASLPFLWLPLAVWIVNTARLGSRWSRPPSFRILTAARIRAASGELWTLLCLLLLVGLLLGYTGLARFTLPTGGATAPPASAAGRRERAAGDYGQWARTAVGLALVLVLAISALLSLTLPDGPGAGGLRGVFWLVASAFGGATALAYLEQLLRRIPGARVLTLARAARYTCIVAGLADAMFLFLCALAPYGNPWFLLDVRPLGSGLTYTLASAAAVSSVAALVLTVLTGWRAWAALRRAARTAAALRADLAAAGLPSAATPTRTHGGEA